MRRLICWLLGHDRMAAGPAKRVCVRCGKREVRRDFGNVIGWEEVGEAPVRGSGA